MPYAAAALYGYISVAYNRRGLYGYTTACSVAHHDFQAINNSAADANGRITTKVITHFARHAMAPTGFLFCARGSFFTADDEWNFRN
jgi:hypothetical protein